LQFLNDPQLYANVIAVDFGFKEAPAIKKLSKESSILKKPISYKNKSRYIVVVLKIADFFTGKIRMFLKERNQTIIDI
jgi:hypothetical protein